MDALRKFAFDTEFDDGGAIASAPAPIKRMYTAAEVEAARQEGYAAGERSVTARAEAAHAAALREVAEVVGAALSALAEVAHEHKAGCAALSLAAGRAIADAALDAFPEAPAAAALQALIHEVESAPRLIVRTGAADPERLAQALEKVAANVGLSGQITIKAEPGMPRAAFVFDWGDGKAAFDPDAATGRVAAALQAALVAEGLHGDPITLPQDALGDGA